MPFSETLRKTYDLPNNIHLLGKKVLLLLLNIIHINNYRMKSMSRHNNL